MEVMFDPQSPWHQITTIATAVLLIGLLGRIIFDRGRTYGRDWKTRIAVLSLSAATAAAFTMAAWNPIIVRKSDRNGYHLALAVDVSDSILRSQEGWPGLRELMYRRLRDSLSNLTEETRRKASASILTFRDEATIVDRKMLLKNLAGTFRRLDERDFAGGKGSNIGAGLVAAGEVIQKIDSQGAILLISDGNQTSGDALAEAQKLAGRGIAVHVFSVQGQGADLKITAADIPRQVEGDVETFLRGLIYNGSGENVKPIIKLEKNPRLKGPPGRYGTSSGSEGEYHVPKGAWGRLHQALKFDGHGLQFVDLSLRTNVNRDTKHRRFFIHVRRPPKILAIGRANQWTRAFSDESVTIEEVHAENLTSSVPYSGYDAIVISSVDANRFKSGVLQSIAQAVEDDGTGLMIINGRHFSASPNKKTILMSYDETDLAPLLPVSSKPRSFLAQPPPRQVVMLIDASGSMSGWPLGKSKEIARHIVHNLLRPQDRLDLVAFTTQALHLMKNRAMDAGGKSDALAQIEGLAAGGGTDPSEALSLIAGRKFNHCGLIFISDGKFDRVAYRPDCRASVFAVGHDFVPADSLLREIADPFPVGKAFDPSQITIPYFEAEPRKKYFEPGLFAPQSLRFLLPQEERLPIPNLRLDGAAITYIREDANLIAVRPRLVDPVLAYHKSGAGYTGVFTTGFPSAWFSSGKGRHAVAAWINRVIPYTARDRYDFKLTDTGKAIELTISLVPQKYRVPDIDHLSVDILVENTTRVSVSMQPDQGSPGTFNGIIRLSRNDLTQKAVLILRESGPDALARPQQIPFVVPYAVPLNNTLPAESYSYGTNRNLLQAIAEIGGGAYDPSSEIPLLREKNVQYAGISLWPYLEVAAVIFYLGAIALHRINP